MNSQPTKKIKMSQKKGGTMQLAESDCHIVDLPAARYPSIVRWNLRGLRFSVVLETLI
jgi:hypothetical protein